MTDFNIVDTIDCEYEFGDPIDNKIFYHALNSRSVISYRYIDLKVTDYHFRQKCFNNDDIIAYFEFVSMLSDYPFNELLDTKDKDWHLNQNYYDKDVRFQKLVDSALGRTKKLPIQCQPQFYHFALYTKHNASRKTGVKSPRIYFFIGTNATIYPLFYDPYHEINP